MDIDLAKVAIPRRARGALGAGFALAALLPTGAPAQVPAMGDREISLDSLLSIEINAASKYGQVVAAAPASVTIVTREEFRRYGLRSLPELLQTLSGFHGTHDRMAFRLGVRGFGLPSDQNNRVLLLLDGHVLNGGFDEGVHLDGISLDMVQHVEIVRGPGSALHGSGALLGVINVVTRPPAGAGGRVAHVEVGTLGERGLSAHGTYALGRQGSVLTAFRWGARRGADLHFPEMTSHGDTGGWARDADRAEHRSGYVSLRHGAVSFAAFAARREKDVPTASFGAAFGVPGYVREDERYFVALGLDRTLGRRTALSGRVSWDTHRRGADVPLDFAPFPFQVREKGSRLGGEVQYRFDPVPWNRVQVGAEVRLRDSASWVGTLGPRTDHLGGTRSLYSLYAQNSLQATPSLSLVAGARLDHYTSAGSAVTPRVGVIFHASRSGTLKALYGEAFRAPSLKEIHLETPGVFMRAEGLVPERMDSWELVWEQRWGSVIHTRASAFRYASTNLIKEVFDPEARLATFQNVARVTTTGAEVEVVGRAGAGSAFAGLALLRARAGEGDEPLRNSPRWTVRAGATTTLRGRADVSALVRADGSRRTLFDTELPAFAVVDLAASLALARGVETSVTVRNALDKAYSHPAGYDHRQVSLPQERRSAQLRLSFRF